MAYQITDDVIINITIIVFLISYLFIFFYMAKKLNARKAISKEKRKVSEEMFFNKLEIGLENGTIQELDDIMIVYAGSTALAQISSSDLNPRADLKKLLPKFIVQRLMVKHDTGTSEDDSAQQNIDLLKLLLDENERTSPYATLPVAERSNLMDMEAFLNDGDVDSAREKARELAKLIQTRNEDNIRLEKINKWSVPLAIVGLIFTIIFGLISLM